MAQGKISARQKMINVMYLVLLALLALNVSSEVLDSFVSIRTRLQASAAASEAYTAQFVDMMEREINQEVANRGDRSNVGLKDTLRNIRSHTRKTIDLLDGHIAEMEALAKWEEATRQYLNPDELERNFRYWMGTDEMAQQRRGNGAAAGLRDSLDRYFSVLAGIYNGQTRQESERISPKILKDPEAAGREDKARRWEQHTFDGPVVANLATLEALKIDVYRQEKELLDLLNTRLGVVPFAPDKVEIISAPVASVVPAGMPFRTRLFVGMSSSEVHPQFGSSHGKITLDEDGNSAWLSIAADGSIIPEGEREGRQTFTATVDVPRANGGFETLTIREEFRVLRPEVRISSASIQSLYRHCSNPINIDVPALGDLFDPVVSATQAQVRTSGQSRKRFMIEPTGQNCVLSVSNRAEGRVTKVEDIRYRVIEPPKPSIEMQVNGRSYNGAVPVARSSRVALRLIADREFAMAQPGDAQYEIGEVVILLQDQLGPARVVKTLNLQGQDATRLQQIPLGPEVQQARPGTQAFVQIREVYRKNYRGERIADTRFPELELTLSLPLR
jgi:gliding motility-associated protein GldM